MKDVRLRFAVFGPPASGKSTTLALVGSACATGDIPVPVRIVDAEFLKYPVSDEDVSSFFTLLENGDAHVLVGCGGIHPSRFRDSGFVVFSLHPARTEYQDRFETKASTRGVGAHTLAEALSVYDSISEKSAELGLISVSTPEDVLSFLKRICAWMIQS